MSASSTNTYRSGLKQFIQFCQSISAEYLPASKQTVALFAAHLSRSVSLTTIKVYLAAVSFQHRRAGLSSPTRHNTSLQLALRGVARKQSGYSRRLRKPITKDILQRLLQILSRPTSTWCSQERAMLAAALCLGFYGFLRGGELMPSSENTFNPRTSLTAADINITSGCLQFSIKRSKTDQLGKGHTITLYKSDTDLCPVYLIQRYLQVSRPSPDQPLLLHCNGRPLYLHQFRAMLRKLLGMAKLQPQEFNTHSLRIGAATSAAEEGVPTRTIKRLGRWCSRAYRLYIRNY